VFVVGRDVPDRRVPMIRVEPVHPAGGVGFDLCRAGPGSPVVVDGPVPWLRHPRSGRPSLIAAIRSAPPNTAVDITYSRGTSSNTVTVTLGSATA